MDKLLKYRVIRRTNVSFIFLEIMAKDMIRKDFELFRLQDKLYELFSDIEFFSHYDDEFLSIKYTVQLAFGKDICEVEENLLGHIYDCALALAFDYKNAKTDPIKHIKRNAFYLAELLFHIGSITEPKEALTVFITDFVGNYPKLMTEQIRKFLNKNLGVAHLPKKALLH